jgi:predicted small lipoprotein YifL
VRIRLALLSGLLLLFLASVLAACGQPQGPLPAGVATPGQDGHYQVGQAASIGSYVITVDRVLYPPELGGVKPDSGKKFLVLDLTIQTTDSSNDRISAAAQLVVKDAEGIDYTQDANVTPATDMSTTQLPDTIPALGKIHGEVAYQVPLDAHDLRLTFNASFLNSLIGHGKELTIDLE